MKNRWPPWILQIVLSLFALSLGYSLGGRQGLLLAFVFVVFFNALLHYYGELRLKTIFKGRKFRGQDLLKIEKIVAELSRQANIPNPQIVIMPMQVPTALSVGRNWRGATIYLSEGLLSTLSPEEIRAVLAIEISKIKRLDILVFSMASLLTSLLITPFHFIDWCLKPILKKLNSPYQLQDLSAPITSLPLRLSIPRSSYYAIDSMASKMTGNPHVLAKTLWKLHGYAGCSPLELSPSTAPLFIVSPIQQNKSSHYYTRQPPVHKRIEKLVGYFPI